MKMKLGKEHKIWIAKQISIAGSEAMKHRNKEFLEEKYLKKLSCRTIGKLCDVST